MFVLENIKKTYKSKKSSDTRALNNINLKLPNKGLVFIVGDSGSGKSTLLNVLGALDSIDEGKILFNGKDISKFNEKEMNSYRNTCIGFVFQDYNVLEQYNVRKNISLALNLQQRSDDKEIDRLLEKLGLNNLGDRNINELSGGQKQRVAIARALIKNPEVILADEPTGNLDSESSNQIFELLKEISKDRLVLVVSHNNEAASLYGDRIIKIKDGIIEEDSNILEILDDNEEINYSSSKLSLKDALKFSFYNINRKKGRFILTILLSALAVLFMVITFNIFIFNDEKYILKVMNDNDEKYLHLYNELCEPSDDGILCYIAPYDTNQFLNLSNNVNVPSGVIYTLFHEGELLNFTYKDLEYSKGYYNDKIPRFVEIKDDKVLGKLIGRTPENNREVVVSESVADRILFSGVKTSDGTFYKPSSFDELLNSDKLFILGPAEVKIVGISLENDDEFNDAKKTNSLVYELEQYYRNDEFKQYDLIYAKDFVDNVELVFNPEELIDHFVIHGSFLTVRNKEYISDVVTYYNFDGERVTDCLEYNQVIISIDSINTANGFEMDFNEFMSNHPEYNYNDALVAYTKEIIVNNEKYKNVKTHFYMDQYLKDELKTDTLEIIGFTASKTSYISPELLNSIKDPNRYTYGLRLYVEDNQELANLIDEYPLREREYKIGNKNVIDMKDRSDITWIIDIYNFVHEYIAIIASVFILFMFLLIYNFILTTIQVSKKDIGVLRALGASNGDVNKIFASEIVILNSVAWIFGIILFFLVLYLINTNNILVYYMKLDLMTVEFTSILFSLLFTLIISFLLSIFSVSRVTRIKPIDAILNK